MVTARFKVNRRTEMGWATEVELTPDYAQGANAEWATATPAGMIRLTIKNDLAAEQAPAFTFCSSSRSSRGGASAEGVLGRPYLLDAARALCDDPAPPTKGAR